MYRIGFKAKRVRKRVKCLEIRDKNKDSLRTDRMKGEFWIGMGKESVHPPG